MAVEALSTTKRPTKTVVSIVDMNGLIKLPKNKIDDGLTAIQRYKLRHPNKAHDYYEKNKSRIKEVCRLYREAHKLKRGKGRPSKSSGEVCPRCQSKHTVKAGFTQSGNPKLLCNDCHRTWSLGKNRELLGDREVAVKEPKPKSREIKVFTPRILPSVDSLIGVPCTCCPDQNRGCDPTTCSKLDDYLQIYGVNNGGEPN